MELLEAWQLSRFPYKDVVYRSIAEEKGRMWWGGFGRGQVDSKNELELTKKALRIAKWDKTLVAIFNVIAAVIPFTAQFIGSPIIGLTSAISLSLAVTFGFTALYSIQTLSSFVSSESPLLLNTLPLDRKEFSLITLFSFVRSVDCMVISSILSQLILVGYYTASPLAVFIMFLASIMNSTLAVATALFFSRIFTKNISSGGRSKSKTFFRLIFILMWGSLLMAVSLLISLPYYIVPSLEITLVNPSQLSKLLFSLFHPFSAGITIGNINQSLSNGLISSICLVAYIIIACFAAKWILKTVNQISIGDGIKMSRQKTKDFSIKTKTPLFGYIIKDLKISSRNPSTAFFFALPVLETFIVSLVIANFEVLRATTILTSTFIGGIFVLLMPLVLLNAEGTGLEFVKTLPVTIQKIITSKAIIATLTYFPVSLVILLIGLMKSITSPILIIIPFFAILSIMSASVFEIQIFFNSINKGKISAIIHDLKKLIIGLITLFLPLGIYSVVFLFSFNHIYAILCLGASSTFELALAIYLLKKNGKYQN